MVGGAILDGLILPRAVRGPYLNDVYYSKFSGFLTPSPHCLHLSDFLELPSLADVIFGLPPQVVPALLLTILVGY